ncbi:MAG: PUA domain-containing protein [Candidatus Hodarchaeota archaeon]
MSVRDLKKARHAASSKGLKFLRKRIKELFPGEDAEGLIPKDVLVEKIHLGNGKEVFVVGQKVRFFNFSGDIFPSIHALLEGWGKSLPRVVVDMGAVPHVVNGADVMAPGVVRVEGEFMEGSLVVVVDENHGQPLAVGTSVFSREIIENMGKNKEKGRVVISLHHVGDSFFKANF